MDMGARQNQVKERPRSGNLFFAPYSHKEDKRAGITLTVQPWPETKASQEDREPLVYSPREAQRQPRIVRPSKGTGVTKFQLQISDKKSIRWTKEQHKDKARSFYTRDEQMTLDRQMTLNSNRKVRQVKEEAWPLGRTSPNSPT